MTLAPKNCILRSKSFDFCFHKCDRIIVKFFLAMMPLYFLLPTVGQATVEKSFTVPPTVSKTPSTDAQACSEKPEPQGISHLVSTSGQVSTWLQQPQSGMQPIIEQLIPRSLIDLSQLHLFTFNSVFARSAVPLEAISIEKPLNLYTQVWQQAILPLFKSGFTFTNPVQKTQPTIDNIPLILISGGKPITIHADSRYQVPEILAKSGTNAIAAVDGTFFSLKYLTSNTMIGPVFSQVNNQFVPGNNSENKKLTNRPLVLISPRAVKYMPFDPDKHNTLAGIQAEMPDVTDAFVAGAFLVINGQPSDPNSFKSLYGSDVGRHRAFWGIDKAGNPTIGVSTKPVDSTNLGIILTKAGFQDAVMLDSGASTSLAYQGKSLVGYVPRPVPHVVALIPTGGVKADCTSAPQ
jgi:hypothetical protein